MSSLSRGAGSRPGRRSPGQALVEFALVAPLFFLILFVIIEGGRFVFFYEMLNNATREGARYAIVHGSNSACPSGQSANTCDRYGERVKDAVQDAAGNLASDLQIFVVWGPPDNNDRGNTVTVSVDYAYDPVIPVLPPITVKAESTLVINN